MVLNFSPWARRMGGLSLTLLNWKTHVADDNTIVDIFEAIQLLSIMGLTEWALCSDTFCPVSKQGALCTDAFCPVGKQGATGHCNSSCPYPSKGCIKRGVHIGPDPMPTSLLMEIISWRSTRSWRDWAPYIGTTYWLTRLLVLASLIPQPYLSIQQTLMALTTTYVLCRPTMPGLSLSLWS